MLSYTDNDYQLKKSIEEGEELAKKWDQQRKILFNKFVSTLLAYKKTDELYGTNITPQFLTYFITTLSTTDKYLYSDDLKLAINELKKINTDNVEKIKNFPKFLPLFYKYSDLKMI
jgi:hypothetical protein